MRRPVGVVLALMLAMHAVAARAEFDPGSYQPITQERLVKDAAANAGKKFSVTDVFQFCGSDFCVQALKEKLDTRRHYCFALGSICLVRMYIRKDHPDAARVTTLRRGDRVTVYGTFDRIGANYNFMVVDRVVVEKPR